MKLLSNAPLLGLLFFLCFSGVAYAGYNTTKIGLPESCVGSEEAIVVLAGLAMTLTTLVGLLIRYVLKTVDEQSKLDAKRHNEMIAALQDVSLKIKRCGFRDQERDND